MLNDLMGLFTQAFYAGNESNGAELNILKF
jgi:hypothetical protein